MGFAVFSLLWQQPKYFIQCCFRFWDGCRGRGCHWKSSAAVMMQTLFCDLTRILIESADTTPSWFDLPSAAYHFCFIKGGVVCAGKQQMHCFSQKSCLPPLSQWSASTATTVLVPILSPIRQDFFPHCYLVTNVGERWSCMQKVRL